MSSETLEDKKRQDTADVEMKEGKKFVDKERDMEKDKEGKKAEADAEEEGKEGEEKEKEAGDEEMVEAEQEKEEPEEKAEDESKDEAEEGKEVKRGRKGSSKKVGKASTANKKDKDESSKEPVRSNERPTRERKTVERYSVPSPGKSASKGFSIEKGRGMQLKDIPNVAYKLSKRKPDDNLQILHAILFGKKTKSHTLKKNIGQFSGYMWIENEEKQRARIKEKLDKCFKEKLLDFSDILNIPINKTAVKKEDLSLKLLEFLESPHPTTDVLLANKEQRGKKRKAKGTTKPRDSGALADRPAKKRKETEAGDKHKHTSEMEKEEDGKAEPSDNKYDSEDDDKEIPEKESDEKENKSEEQEREEEEEEKSKKQVPSEKKSTKRTMKESGGKASGKSKLVKVDITGKSPSKPTKKSTSSATKKMTSDADGASGSASKPKVSATRNKKVEKEREEKRTSTKEKSRSSKKQSSKSSSNVVAKEQGKGKAGKKAKAEPSKEEIHSVVVDILKEVDFDTATLSDIIKLLGKHFDVDLMHRKAEVKAIITDVINNMSDEEDEEDEAKLGDEDEKDEDGDNEN